MKTVRDAVIELDGKLPPTRKDEAFLSESDYPYYFKSNELTEVFLATGCCENTTVCGFDEFEAEAKRMGYINGYLWGKEYPTNGKRPDLPDDVECSVYVDDDPLWWGHGATVSQWDWPNTVAFRITDPRYKPVDEESKPVKSIIQNADGTFTAAENLQRGDLVSVGLMTSKNASDEKPESNWFELGYHPAIGSKVTIVRGNTDLSGFGKSFAGQECTVRAIFKNQYGRDIVSVERPDGACCCFVLDVVEPAKTEREKFIEAALVAVGQPEVLEQHVFNYFGLLFDAGFQDPKVDK